MKIAKLAVVLLGSALLLSGCKQENNQQVNIFDYQGEQTILVDKETGVQYILLNENKFPYQSLTVRLKADGKPMLDKNWKKQ